MKKLWTDTCPSLASNAQSSGAKHPLPLFVRPINGWGMDPVVHHLVHSKYASSF